VKEMFKKEMDEIRKVLKDSLDDLRIRVEKVESAVNRSEGCSAEVALQPGISQIKDLKKGLVDLEKTSELIVTRVTELEGESGLKGLEKKSDLMTARVMELEGKSTLALEQVSSLLEDMKGEGKWEVVGKKKAANAIPMLSEDSFGRWSQGKADSTIVLVGDSMVRGVGRHLERDNEMFTALDFGGAKIEDVEKKMRIVGDKEESHVILWAGTNNLKSDGAQEMLDKYRTLLRTVKSKKYRKITVMGIGARSDVNKFDDGKRKMVNLKLNEMCKDMQLDYFEPGINKWTMLDKRGLHLNMSGQDTIAREIFKYCVKYLN
jgi:hypothetical protein